MSNVTKEELRKLVDFTRRSRAQTQEEISIAIGYGKNYISEVLSPSGKPTQKFYDKLKAYSESDGIREQTSIELLGGLLNVFIA